MLRIEDMLTEEEKNEKFHSLYDTYCKLLLWIAKQRTGSYEVAEECVQETFLYVAKNLEKIGDVHSPRTKGYLVTITEGFSIKAYHREHKLKLVYDTSDHTELSFADKGETAFDAFETVALTMAMDGLSDEERNLIYLYYVYGFRIHEIAKIRGTSDYYIRKGLNLALQKIKYRLEEGGEK